jgi:two-component system, LytTR family, sensor kinase
MPLGRYSNKEPLVLLWVMLPYIIFLNSIVFGTCIFSSLSLFLKSSLYAALYISIIYFVFGMAAMLVKKRFPSAGDMFRRIAILLPLFYVMNVVTIPGYFFIYNQWNLLTCPVKSGMLLWAIIYGCVMSTVITFINEGVANWEAWKASITENERLNNVYQRSRLLGLKGQINPHFLFNCFNTLSGLIQENESKAEQFLDEMTKVHRYLLRSDDELMVSLDMELKFARSYLYLAKERFGEAIRTTIQVDKNMLEMKLPPLSLQVILEDIIYSNALSKADPLTIHIFSKNRNQLAVCHSLHKKKGTQSLNVDEGMENLVNKYKILQAGDIMIHESDSERSLMLPLFENKSGRHEVN